MTGTRRLRIPPNSEIGLFLHEALESGGGVVIDTGEVLYRLDVESADPVQRPASTEVERSRTGIRDAVGSWRDIDAEAFKAYIRQRRRSFNRPPVEL